MSIFPTIAVSVIESIGSDIPAISAGIASLFICFNEMLVLNLRIISYNNFLINRDYY